NRLHRGHHGISGEFSFISNNQNKNAPEFFGETGSVSTLIKAVEKIKGLEGDTLTGEDVFEMIRLGDQEAYRVLEEYCDHIVHHLYNLQHTFDPEKIAIGGGISEQEIFIHCLKERIEGYIEEKPYLLAKPAIVQSTYRNDANLLGALVNYRINHVKKSEMKLI